MADPLTRAIVLDLVFVGTFMLSVGLGTTAAELLGPVRDRWALGRALLANVVLVPVVGVGIVLALGLRGDLALGLLLLGATPGGLFGLQFARAARGDLAYAAALTIGLSLVAAVVLPAAAALLLAQGWAALMLDLKLVGILLLVTGLPLAAGRAFQRWRPWPAVVLGRVMVGLSIVAAVALQVTVRSLVGPRHHALGWRGLTAIVLLVLASWAIGWALGGPALGRRKVLALSTAMRNVAVCWLVARQCRPEGTVDAAILAFGSVATPMTLGLALTLAAATRKPKPVVP